MEKKIIVISMVFLLVITLSVNALGYRLLCLNYGQKIPTNENPRFSCWHDLCQICVADNNNPTNPNYCWESKGCELLGGTELDTTPPDLTVNSPEQDEVYNSRKVLFDLELSEPGSLYYIDNINGRGRWKRLSSNTQSYDRTISLKDGLNDLTIRAKDKNGNSVEIQREFYVDSKKPKISRTYPRRGFASGLFEVQFSEANPEELEINYGNFLTGYKEEELDIEEDCYIEKKKHYCDVSVSLDEYDGQDIKYWFELTDLADTKVKGKEVWLKVDTAFPEIGNPGKMIEKINKRKVYFNIAIEEENLDEVSYYDYSDRRPRWRRLCSRLREGRCEKKKNFKRGEHIVDIQVMDDAGNAISERISFEIDY